MKKIIKPTIIILFTALILANVYIFVAGIKSSVEITKMETELENIKQENYSLESKLGEVSSLEYAASMAANMDLSKKAVPTYLDSLKYALNR